MKKIWKVLLSAVLVLFSSAVMFYCLVAGAPEGGRGLSLYVSAAGGFSLLLSLFVCLCIHYIRYLEKKLEDREDQNGSRGGSA